MKKPLIRLALAALPAFLAIHSARADDAPGELKPIQLRCEYLVNPLAIDLPKPRLRWQLAPVHQDHRGLRQIAYEILATTAAAPSGKPPTILWDSGRIESGETNQIEYSGTSLHAQDQARWKVRVWDNRGGVSPWSEVASWAVGLPNAEDWAGAKWIGDPTPPPKDGFDPLPSPTLRKTFSIGEPKKKIAHATAYITALGLYELHINGLRVGDHVLAPEWTDYTKRVQYQAYDVTPRIRDGDNCIGVMLGDGWFTGKVGLAHIVPKGPVRAIYGRQPRVMVHLDIHFTDGTRAAIVTDGSWQSTLDGPIRVGDILDGETYDARKEMTGWDSAGFDAKGWTPAAICDVQPIALVAQPNEPIRVNRELQAVAMTEPKPGVYVFDLGQNMVGWCRLRLPAKAGTPGTTITIRHAEMLNPDGTIYTTNLRGALQTDRYTLRDDAETVFEPRFTYHGFRYVEVTGLIAKPPLDAVIGRVANSSFSEVGGFESSDPMLNRLWSNILWTQRGNMLGVPTDCPQRDERCGWMGDILAFAPTAGFNVDMAAFFTKFAQDTRDAQATDGRFADFSPHPYDPNTRFSGVPAWGDAGVFVPWVAYQFYGDTRILAEQYPAATRWIEHVRSKNPDLLWKHSRGNDYGDWLNADTLKLTGWPAKGAEVPKHVFATIFFYRSTQIVAEMARVLGKTEDASKYAELAEGIRAAFVKAYISPEGAMEGDTQAGYALALHFGLIPEPLRAAATTRMVERFKPYDGQISTGFHSTLPLMAQLSARGHNDDAYRLLLNRKMPSWGYEVDHGATTIWERWDGWVDGRGFQDPGMNSFAHYAIGAVGEWMYSTMLGIQQSSPGFATVNIHPYPGPGVTWAKGTYESIRGPISSGWEQANGEHRLRVSIPPNVSARIFLPTLDPTNIKLDGKPLAAAAGVTVEDPVDESTVCRVGSGTYEFTVLDQGR